MADENPAPVDATIVSTTSYSNVSVVDAAIGALVYGDRDYPLQSLPQPLENARLIQTNNGISGDSSSNDRTFTDTEYVVFEATADGWVYVA